MLGVGATNGGILGERREADSARGPSRGLGPLAVGVLLLGASALLPGAAAGQEKSLFGLFSPRFEYRHKVVDDGSKGTVGNGDGRIQRGETVDLMVTVDNTGDGNATQTRATVTAPPTEGLVLSTASAYLGLLVAGQRGTARFRLAVGREFASPSLALTLRIQETNRKVVFEETIVLPVDGTPPSVIARPGAAASPASPVAAPAPAPPASTTQGVPAPPVATAPVPLVAPLAPSPSGPVQAGQGLAAAPPPGPAAAPVSPGGSSGSAAPPALGTASPPPAAAPSGGLPGAPAAGAAPLIALAAPGDGDELRVDSVVVVGAAAVEGEVARIEVRVNGELVADRRTRGVVVVPTGGRDGPTGPSAPFRFSERVGLRPGKNEIAVTAISRQGAWATRRVTVTRLVEDGRIFAAVIGISRYQAVPSLRYAERDALAIRDYLLQLGVPPENIALLVNEQATLQNLKRVLGTELRRKAGEHDTVIIYYAGHGAPETDATGGEDDGLEKYLIPHDADPRDLYTTALPMREIETILSRLSAERVVFISDACFSGATAGRTFTTGSRRAVVSDTFLARLAKGKGRVVLTASRASEVSEERDELGHGVFTYFLLEGLRGAADFDGDGLVSVDEAYRYVAGRVPDATGQNQHPTKRGDVEGELILGRVPKR